MTDKNTDNPESGKGDGLKKALNITSVIIRVILFTLGLMFAGVLGAIAYRVATWISTGM